MGLVLHIREVSSGRWSCSLGDHRCDSHADLGAALAHMEAEADEIDETELLIHFRDGTTEQEPMLPPVTEY